MEAITCIFSFYLRSYAALNHFSFNSLKRTNTILQCHFVPLKGLKLSKATIRVDNSRTVHFIPYNNGLDWPLFLLNSDSFVIQLALICKSSQTWQLYALDIVLQN